MAKTTKARENLGRDRTDSKPAPQAKRILNTRPFPSLFVQDIGLLRGDFSFETERLSF